MGARYLPIYVNDHRLGATAAHELAKRVRGASRGEPLAEVADRIAREIDEDKSVMADVLRRVGSGTDRAKWLTGLAAEKLGRLKLNGHLLSPSPLSRLTELDGLCLSADARGAFWEALAALDHPALEGLDLQALADRAWEQRETLEPLRVAAARAALIED